jgi:hypothetical protein
LEVSRKQVNLVRRQHLQAHRSLDQHLHLVTRNHKTNGELLIKVLIQPWEVFLISLQRDFNLQVAAYLDPRQINLHSLNNLSLDLHLVKILLGNLSHSKHNLNQQEDCLDKLPPHLRLAADYLGKLPPQLQLAAVFLGKLHLHLRLVAVYLANLNSRQEVCLEVNQQDY